MVDWREGWFDGRSGPQRTADLDLLCDQLQAALERSQQRGRGALVVADNLRTHTPEGSLRVRALLAAAQGQLRLVDTPADDPEANRIAGLWRLVRHAVTPNHQRTAFDQLLADLEAEFATLATTPRAVLAHIGSPAALGDDPAPPLAFAA